jgi:hypothetical protein
LQIDIVKLSKFLKKYRKMHTEYLMKDKAMLFLILNAEINN